MEAGDTLNGDDEITNVADTSGIKVGMRVLGTGLQDDTLVTSVAGNIVGIDKAVIVGTIGAMFEFQDRFSIGGVDYWASSIQNPATNEFEVDVSGTPAQNIAQTATNLINLINVSPSNTLLYAYYISGVEDLPGQILFEERSIGGKSSTPEM